jgi:hypothetical protein
MSPLETLFRLEMDFHRRLRTQAPGTADTRSLHTSYALQSGYEPLIRSLGTITARDVETLRARLTLAGDTRDVLAARDSLKLLLGFRITDSWPVSSSTAAEISRLCVWPARSWRATS